jgi:ribosome-associated toxin RatA of RatAB toxin-antitoxin module
MTGAKGINSDLAFSPPGSGSEEGFAAAEEVMPAPPSQAVAIHTEQLEGRKRRIVASTEIPFALEQVWQVLTDYDHLADFIPNLTESQRIQHPEGGIRLVQVGTQCFLNVKFCARVVLDMLEMFPRELSFSMVEGDFRQFEGKWLLEPLTSENAGTHLSYDLMVLPPRAMPAGLIERHICRDLSQNLKAIGDRATFLFG